MYQAFSEFPRLRPFTEAAKSDQNFDSFHLAVLVRENQAVQGFKGPGVSLLSDSQSCDVKNLLRISV